PVLGGDLVEVVRGLERARSRHVLCNHRWLAGNMPAEVARDHAAVEIVAAAGGVADGDGDGLAREELIDPLRGGAGRGKQRCRERRVDEVPATAPGPPDHERNTSRGSLPTAHSRR